jgi:xylulokinase
MDNSHQLFLGLDCSTQGIKATVINEHLEQIYETVVNYDKELPQYKTEGGVIKGSDGLTHTTPTILWIHALDIILQKMKKDHFPFHKVMAISGSGQQHGR